MTGNVISVVDILSSLILPVYCYKSISNPNVYNNVVSKSMSLALILFTSNQVALLATAPSANFVLVLTTEKLPSSLF